jgi:hypothetical protein
VSFAHNNKSRGFYNILPVHANDTAKNRRPELGVDSAGCRSYAEGVDQVISLSLSVDYINTILHFFFSVRLSTFSMIKLQVRTPDIIQRNI